MLYGLSPKFGALLVAMPRAVLGGVFVLVCGMIVASGMRLLAETEASLGNLTVIGTTLVAAVAVPVHVQTLDLSALPTTISLLLGNSVVLAVVLGVALNLVLVELLGNAGGDPP